MVIKFVKMSGAGNDFIVFDNRAGKVKNLTRLAQKLCPRRTAVGADGILALERSKSADIRMRYLNADGSEAEMCGNGARCLAYYAYIKKAAKRVMTIETLAGPHRARLKGKKVSLEMPPPSALRLGSNLRLPGGRGVILHSVNTGVPHAVMEVKDIETVDVAGMGAAIRHHRHFAPAGTNANFVQYRSDGIYYRIYERGVEEETLASGTGAAAVATVSVALGLAKSPVRMRARSGIILTIGLGGKAPDFTSLTLEGPVEVVYEGKANI